MRFFRPYVPCTPTSNPAAIPKELAQTFTYIDGHRHATIDYEADKAAGEHVGSGAIEKAGDLAVNRRFKGHRGMRWWRDNVNASLTLRVLHLNGEWDSRWQATRHTIDPAA